MYINIYYILYIIWIKFTIFFFSSRSIFAASKQYRQHSIRINVNNASRNLNFKHAIYHTITFSLLFNLRIISRFIFQWYISHVILKIYKLKIFKLSFKFQALILNAWINVNELLWEYNLSKSSGWFCCNHSLHLFNVSPYSQYWLDKVVLVTYKEQITEIK